MVDDDEVDPTAANAERVGNAIVDSELELVTSASCCAVLTTIEI